MSSPKMTWWVLGRQMSAFRGSLGGKTPIAAKCSGSNRKTVDVVGRIAAERDPLILELHDVSVFQSFLREVLGRRIDWVEALPLFGKPPLLTRKAGTSLYPAAGLPVRC